MDWPRPTPAGTCCECVALAFGGSFASHDTGCKLSRGSFMQVFKVVEVTRVLTWKFYLERILPVGLFMALTLLFGNIVYLYLTVSFIQMLKVKKSHS